LYRRTLRSSSLHGLWPADAARTAKAAVRRLSRRNWQPIGPLIGPMRRRQA